MAPIPTPSGRGSPATSPTRIGWTSPCATPRCRGARRSRPAEARAALDLAAAAWILDRTADATRAGELPPSTRLAVISTPAILDATLAFAERDGLDWASKKDTWEGEWDETISWKCDRTGSLIIKVFDRDVFDHDEVFFYLTTVEKLLAERYSSDVTGPNQSLLRFRFEYDD